MKRLLTIFFALGVSSSSLVYAQFGSCDCTASITGGGTKNFSALSWTNNSGTTTCPSSGDASYTGQLCLSMSNGSTLNFDVSSFTINGNFKITNSGSSANIDILTTNTLHVTGNMGYTANNNITYTIDGTLTVDGTLYGKNSNTFSGSGTYNGGYMNFDNGSGTGASCPSCNITWNIPPANCTSAGNFCTTTLPIKLSTFTSKVNGRSIELGWATSAEINFNYFSVEKSSNGKDFSEITQVPSHGTSSEGHTYQFEDTAPYLGKNYYRLTSVDFDNYRETFKVIEQDYSGDKEFYISPNPTDGSMIKVNFNFENTSDAHVTIFDNIGYAVGTYQVTGIGSIAFDSPLKTGIYLAKYSSDSFSKTVRFVVK